MLSLQSAIQAILSALSRPPQLAAQIAAARRAAERAYRALVSSSSGSASSTAQGSSSARWPLGGLGLGMGLGLLDETRQRIHGERADRARRTAEEADALARELRYTQQTVAAELAGWQDLHGRLARAALREHARAMLVLERERLAGLRRAARQFRAADPRAMGSGIVAGGGPEAWGAGAAVAPGGSTVANSSSSSNGKRVADSSRKAAPAAPVTTTANAVADADVNGAGIAGGDGGGDRR